MKLSHSELHSELWAKIASYYGDRLQSLRVQNDADRQSDETAKLRGRILEVKNLLALGEQSQAPESGDESLTP